jgi:hypothetical protein
VGAGFVVLFWLIVFTPIGVVLGAILSFVVPVVYYGIRRTPAEKRKRGFRFHCGFAVIFGILFAPAVCALLLFLSFVNSGDYWNHEGAFDYYRMPLEPPYQLSMIDTLDDAGISKWKEGSQIVWNITKYEKRGPLIAGFREEERTSREPAWFLFDCSDGAVSKFADEESLSRACAERGFTPPLAMRSIKENWDSYWKDPKRRKK